MSVVTVQLGQCGNQIGRQLFSTLREDALATLRSGEARGEPAYFETSLERFFVADSPRNSNPLARAVLVDMEAKVVQQTLLEVNKTGKWRYDPACVYAQKRGSGNNWARGYHHYGPRASERVLDMIQSQAEKCDHLSGFLILMSVAGGTGAGVGSYLTECVKDCYPSSSVFNQVVWPYSAGEVIVQDYNAILTFAHLQKSSDAIIVVQNDQLHKACSKLLLLKDISFSDINSVICHSLASALQPSTRLNNFRYCGKTEDRLFYDQCLLRDIQTQLCPLQDFKILSLKSVPQMPERSHAYSHYLWPGLLKHLRQMLVTDAPIEEGMDWSVGLDKSSAQKSLYSYEWDDPTKRAFYTPTGLNKSIANLVIARGNELETADLSPFMDHTLYCRWAPQEFACSMWASRHAFNKYEKSCTLLSNSQSCVSPLDSACRKAWQMYAARAYVHQYLQNGLSEQDFLDCFVCTEQTLKTYTTFT